MDMPETVTEAVTLLEHGGYAGGFLLRDGMATCGACAHQHALSDLVIDRLFRFEGDTDPADEAIVVGVRCVVCGALGVIVSAFGPDADPALAQLVRRAGGR